MVISEARAETTPAPDGTPKRPAEGNTVLTGLRLGFRSLQEHPLLAVAFLTAILAQGSLQGMMIWALREVLLSFEKSADLSTGRLVGASLGVLAIWMLRSVGVFAADVLSIRLAHRVEVESMLRVLRKLVSLSIRFYDRSSQADLVMASYHDLKGVRIVTLELGRLALFVSQLAGLVVVAWLMSPKLALIGIVTVPLGALPAYWLGREITTHAKRERQEVMSLYDSFLQVCSGIRTIKINRAEDRVLRGAESTGWAIWRHMVRQAEARGLTRLLMEGISGFGLIMVLIVGGRDVSEGQMAWQSLLGLLLAVMAIYSPVIGFVQIYGGIRGIIPSLDRIDRVWASTPEIEDRPGAKHLKGGPQQIELRDVSFAYEQQPVLSGISATVSRGETIGIVGPSGVGKSTLLSLLVRFYDATSGAVLYDGVDVKDLRHADLMDQSAIVLQEPFLLLDTVANNIRIGRPNATMEEVVAAATAANIHDDIVQMEQGYETVLGRGPASRSLSGGQKQRICIAAALLKNAPLLFLDEATNSLDSVAEQKVQGAIERLMRGRTSFVIAHRLSTLRHADRILVLEGGRLVDIGPHQDLLVRCSIYRDLWGAQAPEFARVAERGAGTQEVLDSARSRRVAGGNV
jgi:subfamily B ATP-binding cassette protein MsbA